MRFTCQPGCTNCCRVKGYVYLTEDDLRRAAAFLGLSCRDFEAKHVYRTRHLLRLRKPRHAQCCFLNETGCLLHPAKPTQCRLFPFWPELVGARAAWREVARICPGIGQGQLKSVETVRRLTLKMRQAYSSMYPDAGA
ncbi:MAG: YkgJ family cysteine cluster protein [Acidobacteriales bacterium]|nr:MAG: YkgJ family cysteine cluster protein [Terriglobales bacterium]